MPTRRRRDVVTAQVTKPTGPFIMPVTVVDERLAALPEAMRRCRLRIRGGHDFVEAGVTDVETDRNNNIVIFREIERCARKCGTIRRRWVERIPRWVEGRWAHKYDPLYRIVGITSDPPDDQYVIQERQRAKHPELFQPNGNGRKPL